MRAIVPVLFNHARRLLGALSSFCGLGARQVSAA